MKAKLISFLDILSVANSGIIKFIKTNNTLKILPLSILLLTPIFANAQTLPINFETTILTADFINFDGGTATVINNPQPNGINTSATVARIVRNGGAVWAGSKLLKVPAVQNEMSKRRCPMRGKYWLGKTRALVKMKQ